MEKNKTLTVPGFVSSKGTNKKKSKSKVLGEMVYSPENNATSFIIMTGGEITQANSFKSPSGVVYRPYRADHSLIKHGVLRLPQQADPYDSVENLKKEIRHHIHKYVDLSSVFETIAVHYVLLSWVQDICDVIPYIRIRGQWGSGKTRFLSIIGNICYRPIFVSGAASVASIFRLLNDIRGTLVLDEGDFSYSSEKSEIVKIFNNGNAKGFPILRCEQTKRKTFEPRSFNIYGAKILASRGRFDDDALESRFLTEEAGVRKIRSDMPLSLDANHDKSALRLRNKLLQFRFDHFATVEFKDTTQNTKLSHRSSQIINPLLTFMDSSEKQNVTKWLSAEHSQLQRDEAMNLPSQILSSIQLMKSNQVRLQIGSIRKQVIKQFSEYHDFSPSSHTIGKVVRNVLQLKTKRTRGVFVIAPEEYKKIDHLCEKYGLNQQ